MIGDRVATSKQERGAALPHDRIVARG